MWVRVPSQPIIANNGGDNMTVAELMNRLSQFPPNMQVETHLSGSTKLHKPVEVYIGNEKYMPAGKTNQPDKVFIDLL